MFPLLMQFPLGLLGVTVASMSGVGLAVPPQATSNMSAGSIRGMSFSFMTVRHIVPD